MSAVLLRAAATIAALVVCAQAQTVPVPVVKLLADAREALGGEAPVQFAAAPDDASAVVVTLNGSTRRLSFDSETHLPLRLDDLVYSDYRDVGGVKVPFRFVRETPGGVTFEEWRVRTVRHNVALNDRTFRR